jgi:hypothetical protein
VALLFGAEVNAEVERRRAPERALLAESVDEEAVAEAPVADG